MTVSVQAPVIEYVANGSSTVFSYPFLLIISSDIKVYFNNLLVTTGYTVSGTGVESGGSVTFTVPPANGTLVKLLRSTPLNRTTDYVEGGALRANVLDNDIDRVVMQLQDVRADSASLVEFAALLDETRANIDNIETNASNAAASAAAALASQNSATASEAGIASSASTATTQAGIATTQAGIATTGASTATTQAGIATTQASNASSSASTATTQAGIATTQAGIATTQASNASGSAGTATTQAGNAATQAGIATTQAGIATTQAGNAATSATTAQAFAGAIPSVSTGAINRAIVGMVRKTAAGLTIPSGVFLADDIFAIQNTTDAAVTITQGAGLTLRNGNAPGTGNRTLGARAIVTLYASSGTDITITGSGLT